MSEHEHEHEHEPEHEHEHEHGKMDVSEQEKVFGGFVKFIIYLIIFSVIALVFLAIFNS